MKKRLNDYFSTSKNLIKFGFLLFVLVGLFSFKQTVKASNYDKEITFHLTPEETFKVQYNYGDTIDEYPIFETAIFEGWYDETLEGENYYLKEVNNETPENLYSRALNKYNLDDFVFEEYEDGYELVSYLGDDNYFEIPWYFYKETETPNVYEIKKVLSIKENAFLTNNNIYNLIIPKTIKNIDEGAFNGLNTLFEMFVSFDNPYFESDYQGALYTKNYLELLFVPKNSYFKDFFVHEDTTTIKKGAFNGVQSLKRLVLNSFLLEIEEEAFINNENLELVIIPNSVINVGDDILTGSNSELIIYYEDEVIPLTWNSNWNNDGFTLITDYGSLSFEVVFKDEDETILKTEIVPFGGSATPPEEPTKDSTAEFHYNFSYWDGNYDLVFSDSEVTANYYSELRKYTVTFYDAYDEVYEIIELFYGEDENNNYYNTDITKESDLKYTYIFSHWETEEGEDLTFIYKDVNAFPIFEEILIYYDVTFYWDDGNSSFSNLSGTYGAHVEAPTNTPTKDSSEEYNYTFSGWYIDLDKTIPYTEDVVILGENINVYPKYEESLKTYTVIFFNEHSKHDEVVVEHGFAAILPEDPAKASTAQYDYVFVGWDKDLTSITETTFVYAMYDEVLRQYNVIFYDAYNNIIKEGLYDYGTTTVEAPLAPEKERTQQYTYVFRDWDRNFDFVYEQMHIYPLYYEELNKYEVLFYSDDSLEDLISTQNINYGSKASSPYVYKTPTPQYYYEFKEWSEDISNIVDDLIVYAIYTPILRSYNVSFYMDNGVLIDSFEVFYGTAAVAPDNPLKPKDQKYTYEFSHWSEDFSFITEDLYVYATFEGTLNKYTYSFYNYDGTLLKTLEADYGTVIVAPDVPFKDSTNKYDYDFAGWDKNFYLLEEDIMITATYTERLREFIVNFYNEDILFKTEKVEYGNSAITPNNPTKQSDQEYHYEFKEWDKDFTNIIEDLNVYAVYEKTLRKYTVTFYNENVLFKTVEVEYGTAATIEEIPLKDSTEQYDYEFNSWSEDITNIVNNLTVYAQYNEILRKYTVTYYNADLLTVFKTEKVEYGSEALMVLTPEKDSTNEYSYIFDKWSESLNFIYKDINVYPQYKEIPNVYEVTFNTLGGSETPNVLVSFDNFISRPTIPLKTGYSFGGWYKDEVCEETWDFNNDKMPAENITLYALWSINSYTIYFNVDGGTPIDSITTLFNEPIIEPLTIKTGYSFIGWYKDEELTNKFVFDLMPAENITLYALWAINTYTITFDSLGGTLVNAIEEEYGATIVNPANPTKLGYNFVGWYKDENFEHGYNLGTMPAENITLYAKWEVKSYTITFNSNEGSSVSSLTINYNEEIMQLPISIKVGYSFGGWYKDEELTNEFDLELMPAENITLYALWNINSYTVTFNSNGGSSVSSQNKTYNTLVNKPADPTRLGYSFVGWFKTNNLLNAWLFEEDKVPANDITLYAKWEINYYTITFNSNGGTVIEDLVRQYNYPITLGVSTKTGHSFIGWYIDEELTNEFDLELMPAENITLYALWEANSYTISFNSNGGTTIESITKKYDSSLIEPESPYKEGFNFMGWYLDNELYTFNKMPAENITLIAKWIILEFTVKFYSEDIYLGEVVVLYGNNASFAEPTKASTEQYDYEFDGWSLSINNVTSDLTVYALFKEVLRKYDVVFYNDEEASINNEVIKRTSVDYGSAAIAPGSPTKPQTEEYEYIFDKWSKDFSEVKEELHIYPIFIETRRVYTIKFYLDDKTTLLDEIEVYYNETAETLVTPTKSSTDQYDYEFAGWDKDLTNIQENLNVYAVFTTSLREYDVNFYNYNESLIETQKVLYGNSATAPKDPQKPPSEQFTYTFSNWDKDFTNITKDLNIYPIFNEVVRMFTVYFYDEYGLYLYDSIKVSYGQDITTTIIPGKDSTEQYNYEFIGWDKDLTNITETFSTRAIYKRTLRSYNVYFYNDDGSELLSNQRVEYGGSAVAPAIPEKPSTPKYSYIFVGWNLDFSFVDGNMRVYAVFEETINRYTVRFYNDDGSVLYKTTEVLYGDGAIPFANPTKEATKELVFTFDKWSEDYSEITENLDVYASFISSPRMYLVRFYNDDVLYDEQLIAYGLDAVVPSDPFKNSTAQYNFNFIGWSDNFNEVENDLNIYALYEEIVRSYSVKFYNALDEVIKEESVLYNESATSPDDPLKDSTQQYDYIFVGWSVDFSEVKSNLDVYPQYENSLKKYVVNFYNEGVLYDTQEIYYGQAAVEPEAPVKEKTDKYTYTFNRWDRNFSFVTNNLEVNAVYNEIINKFTVKFYNDEELLSEQLIEYGRNANPPHNPTKPTTPKHTYTFVKWDKAYNNVTEDLAVYAIYEESLREYVVTFYNESGFTILKSEKVYYQGTVEAPAEPSKASTNQYDYEFIGWSEDFSVVTKNLKIYPLYKETLRQFEVRFYNSLDELIETKTVSYGNGVTPPEAPTKEKTAQYEFIFTGWNRTLTNIYNNLDVYPQYDSVLRVFVVEFYNGDVLHDVQEVTYGSAANVPIDPIKDETDKYTYNFISWDENFNEVTEDLKVYAYFKETIKTFKVSFYLDDKLTKIFEEVVTYGESANLPEAPSKDSTQQYHYEFVGWDKDHTNIKEDVVLFAVFEEILNEYQVNFYNEDVLHNSQTVKYGRSASEPIVPIKEPSEKYNYKFIGWSESYNFITKDIDLYAVFEENIKMFTVAFYSDDGTTLLRIVDVPYDGDATPPVEPRKHATDKYTYEFVKWDKDYTNIKQDTNIYAEFKEVLRKFAVKFYSEGKLYDEQLVEYGSSAIKPENPTKESTTLYKYEFIGWSIDFSNVISDLNINAVYEESSNEYNVVFYYDNGEIYKEFLLPYGSIIEEPASIEKEDDAKYTYEFAGWEGYIPNMTVRKDESFTPIYNKVEKIYEVIIIVDRRECKYELSYGDDFPDVSQLKMSSSKYSYYATKAIDKEGIEIIIPEKVLKEDTITPIFETFINSSYYQSFINSFNFSTVRDYRFLVEAYEMLDEVKEEDYNYLSALFNSKKDQYNRLVEELNEELEVADNYEQMIYNKVFIVYVIMQNISYICLAFLRRGYY